MVFFFPLMVVIIFVLWVVGKNTPPPEDEIVLKVKLDIESEDDLPKRASTNRPKHRAVDL